MRDNESASVQWSDRERLLLGAAILVAVAMYFPTFKYLWHSWMTNIQYSIAFLVPIVCGYFAYKNWPAARKLERSPSGWGLVLIALGLVLHLSGTLLDVSGPSALSIIILIVGGCMYFHSSALAKLMWFPLAYMLFMIPVPGGVIERIGLPMQIWASAGTASLLHLMHIDVARAGIQLSVDGFDFQIAEACSGMSSLVALVGVTAVFAYSARLPNKYKLALLALSLPVALAANIIRITSIALVGCLGDWDVAVRVYHNWSSPLLFLAAIVLLFFINWGFECLSARRTTSS
jgi:exosortase